MISSLDQDGKDLIQNVKERRAARRAPAGEAQVRFTVKLSVLAAPHSEVPSDSAAEHGRLCPCSPPEGVLLPIGAIPSI